MRTTALVLPILLLVGLTTSCPGDEEPAPVEEVVEEPEPEPEDAVIDAESIERAARAKKGAPPHSTTGVLRISCQ